MKKIKKILTIFTAFALCLVPLLSAGITAQAEETVTTYYVKYVSDSADWRFQTGGWKEDGYHRELYYLYENIQDGDKLVIEGTGEKTLNMNINANLSELTFFGASLPVVTAKSIDTVYGLFNSSFAVNGDVKNAYLYDNCVCNFNNNVGYLEIIDTASNAIKSAVYVVGTVDHAKAVGTSNTIFDLYNFQAGSFRLDKNALVTSEDKYSQTPTATEAPAPTEQPASSTTSTTTSDGEYDDVPKTADNRFNPLWLVGMAAVCLAGSYALKKEN